MEEIIPKYELALDEHQIDVYTRVFPLLKVYLIKKTGYQIIVFLFLLLLVFLALELTSKGVHKSTRARMLLRQL